MTTDTKQQTRLLVQTAAAVCIDKKGEETRILELDPIDSGLSDFFLVTSATNDRQAIAIADEIEHRLKKEFGVFPNSVEGRRKGDWILLDYVDFVVHVFLTERRAFYDIERLRKSARPKRPSPRARRLRQKPSRRPPRLYQQPQRPRPRQRRLLRRKLSRRKSWQRRQPRRAPPPARPQPRSLLRRKLRLRKR